MGGAAARPGVSGCAELLGDGPASQSAAGEGWRNCGLAGGAEGSAESYAW